MTVVGLNYGFAGQMKVDEITGGAPYGATTIAGPDAQRQPSEKELAGARYQGRAIAETAERFSDRVVFQIGPEQGTFMTMLAGMLGGFGAWTNSCTGCGVNCGSRRCG